MESISQNLEDLHLMKKNSLNFSKVFIEPKIDGLELQCGIIANKNSRTHSHPEYCFILTDMGCRGISQFGKKKILTPGSLCIMNQNDPHGGFSLGQIPWAYRGLSLEKNIFNRFVGIGTDCGRFPGFKGLVYDFPKANALFKSLFDTCLKPFSTLQKEIAVVKFLDCALTNFKNNKFEIPEWSPKEREKINVLKNYLDNNFLKNNSLINLTQVLDYHPNYILRLFKLHTGFTPHNYLIDLRVREVKRLIKNGEPLAEAAIYAGFFDQSHMHKKFKNIFGFTPGQYQKALKRI